VKRPQRGASPTYTFACTTGWRDDESVTRPVTAVCCASAVPGTGQQRGSARAPTLFPNVYQFPWYPSRLRSKGCIDNSNDGQRMQPVDAGLPAEYIAGTTMSEGTPSTPDEGSAHAVTPFAGTTTTRNGKTASAPSASARHRAQSQVLQSNLWTAIPHRQGQQDSFMMSGICEARTAGLGRTPFRFVAWSPQLFEKSTCGGLRGFGLVRSK